MTEGFKEFYKETLGSPEWQEMLKQVTPDVDPFLKSFETRMGKLREQDLSDWEQLMAVSGTSYGGVEQKGVQDIFGGYRDQLADVTQQKLAEAKDIGYGRARDVYGLYQQEQGRLEEQERYEKGIETDEQRYLDAQKDKDYNNALNLLMNAGSEDALKQVLQSPKYSQFASDPYFSGIITQKKHEFKGAKLQGTVDYYLSLMENIDPEWSWDDRMEWERMQKLMLDSLQKYNKHMGYIDESDIEKVKAKGTGTGTGTGTGEPVYDDYGHTVYQGRYIPRRVVNTWDSLELIPDYELAKYPVGVRRY